MVERCVLTVNNTRSRSGGIEPAQADVENEGRQGRSREKDAVRKRGRSNRRELAQEVKMIVAEAARAENELRRKKTQEGWGAGR